jgi:hypothetical protein
MATDLFYYYDFLLMLVVNFIKLSFMEDCFTQLQNLTIIVKHADVLLAI